MDAKAFFNLVASMREAQKNYFKTRSQGYLNESKSLEREVDNEIKRVRGILNREPSLFDEAT